MLFKRPINLKSDETIMVGHMITFVLHDNRPTATNSYDDSKFCCLACGKSLTEPMLRTKVSDTYYAYCGSSKCRKQLRRKKMLEKLNA